MQLNHNSHYTYTSSADAMKYFVILQIIQNISERFISNGISLYNFLINVDTRIVQMVLSLALYLENQK